MMRTTVHDVMTKQAITVGQDMPFKQVARVLVSNGISAVPVLDADNRVVGVVSEGDLMRKEEFREQYHGESYRPSLRARLRRKVTMRGEDTGAKAAADTAAGLMTAPAVTVAPHASTVRAARLMDEYGVKRLIVVDEEGRLEGVVSRRDLLRAYLRDDEDTRRLVVAGIPAQDRWNDRDGILVEVHDGIVTLSGYTDRRSQAQAAVHAAENLGGVVDVREDLVWRRDDVLELPYSWDRP
ncbi:CBS domain-containing protein [Nonomuraea monospora]|uniref:CBS domain-containing protein n=1 Tax=Nonomuraea monospora TaxID=568818 RepID=A0ABP5Q115_9ACTN